MKTAFFALFVLAAGSAHASNYPGDYSVKNSCQTQGPVTVCRGLQPFTGLAVLDVTYNGKLAASSGQKMWIQVNYQNGPVQMEVSPRFVNAEANVAIYRVTGGCFVGRMGRCDVQGSREMRDLLIWAQTQSGTLNALDVEMAFHQGPKWDNNHRAFGSYRFYFPEN